MPGVSYERQLQFTPSGPVVVHILRAPRPGGLYALRPLLSNDTLLGRETVTSMQKRAMSSANVAGVNGDLFTWDEGLPSGMLMQSGVLEAPPHPKRSTLGITDDGSLLIDRVTMLGPVAGLGPAESAQRPQPAARRAGHLALHSGLGRGHPAGERHGRGRARAVAARGPVHRPEPGR